MGQFRDVADRESRQVPAPGKLEKVGRVKKSLPNFFSFLVLACGFASLAAVLEGSWDWALRWLLLAGILDGAAGTLAYRFKGNSAFGEELDGLASLCSLGVCPLAYAYEASLRSL